MHRIALFFLLFISIKSYAQDDFFQGTYTYSFNGHGVFGSNTVSFREYIPEGNLYVFTMNREVLFFDDPVIDVQPRPDVVIDCSVPNVATYKIREDGPEHLLYDFNLAVDEEYIIYPDLWTAPGSDSMKVKILGYGDSLVSGQVLHYQYVEYSFDTSPYIIRDYKFRGIGSLLFYLDIFDIFNNDLGGGQGGPLVCYENNVFNFENSGLNEFFINELSARCLDATSTDFHVEDRIQVYPNPAIDHVLLKLDGRSGNEKVSLLSASGKAVKRFSLNELDRINEKTYRLSLDGISRGMYFLFYKQYTYKLVKI